MPARAPNTVTVVATDTGGAVTTLQRSFKVAGPAAKPSNAFTIGRLTVSRSGKGVALVTVPGPGGVDLRLRAVRPVGHLVHLVRRPGAKGSFRLTFKVPAKARTILKRRRVRAVERVQYTPTGGSSASHSVAVTVGFRAKR